MTKAEVSQENVTP